MRDSSVGRTTTTTISSCEWNKKNPLNILTQNTTLYPLLHTIHWPVFAFLFRSFPFITANPNFAFISSWLLYFLPFRVVTVLTSNQIGKQQKAEGWRKRGGGEHEQRQRSSIIVHVINEIQNTNSNGTSSSYTSSSVCVYPFVLGARIWCLCHQDMEHKMNNVLEVKNNLHRNTCATMVYVVFVLFWPITNDTAQYSTMLRQRQATQATRSY